LQVGGRVHRAPGRARLLPSRYDASGAWRSTIARASTALGSVPYSAPPAPQNASATARGAKRTTSAVVWWLWLLPVLLWFSVAVAIGSTRYRTPVDPFLIMFAAAALARPRVVP